MKEYKKNKIIFLKLRKVFFDILLIIGSCVLGTYSWIWLASIFLSSRTTLVSVKNMDVVVRSLFLFVLFVGGYVCLLLWLRKVRHRYFILVNIFCIYSFIFCTTNSNHYIEYSGDDLIAENGAAKRNLCRDVSETKTIRSPL